MAGREAEVVCCGFAAVYDAFGPRARPRSRGAFKIENLGHWRARTRRMVRRHREVIERVAVALVECGGRLSAGRATHPAPAEFFPYPVSLWQSWFRSQPIVCG
jgi:hypothetical protein